MITWDPWAHRVEWYPDVRVIETVQLVDSRLTTAERRPTLAYELGVLELGPFDQDRGDGAAAGWASWLLIPFDDLLAAAQRSTGLHEAAATLRVDVPMLRARLRRLSEEERALLDLAR
ncbi:ImmA/IrrE family metallo-endopeptidase [Blastococcus montanus]|uniref:ImmA/IrrE family metallo-endopeptidase n=1 Tax=Blastococcus montanus TaxID=3144973 RepID=UPI00320A8A30